MLFVHQVATGTPSVLADSAEDGGLVTGLSPGVVLQLAAYYAIGDQADFQRVAASLANAGIQAAEDNAPEYTPMQLQITGLWGPTGSIAGALAGGVNQDWRQGKIQQSINGVTEPLLPWDNASAIAYADDSTATLTLQWIKGQPWAYVLIGLLVIIAAVALYDILTGSKWSLTGWLATSGASGSGVLAGAANFVAHDWPWLVVGGVVVAGVPWLLREAAEARQAEYTLAHPKAGVA